MIKTLRRYFKGEQLYRAFKCPECTQPFTLVRSHIPEAPGSTEGLICFDCRKIFTFDRHRKGARVEVLNANYP